MFLSSFSRLLAVAAAFSALLFAQAPPRTRIIGAVSGASASSATVKTDTGEVFAVVFAPETRFQKVAPGEKDLSKAQEIAATDLAAGDRVLVRGTMSGDGKSFAAKSVVLMSARDIAQKQDKERAEWTHRGTAGLVVSTDPAAKEIKVRIPSMFGPPHFMTVAILDKTRFLRYSPESVRFADAKPSTIAEVNPGDQLRVLGDKNEDGTRIAAEQVLSGSFHTAAGAVTALNTAANELQIKELGSGKVLTVKITPDSVLHRLPQVPMGGMAGGPGERRSGPPSGAAAGGPSGMHRGGPDLQQMLEHLPATSLGEIKTGEMVVIASTVGVNPDHVTAVTLLAGADALITMSQAAAAREQGRTAQGGQSMGSWNLGDVSMIPMQ
jgi:hypothetical protein